MVCTLCTVYPWDQQVCLLARCDNCCHNNKPKLKNRLWTVWTSQLIIHVVTAGSNNTVNNEWLDSVLYSTKELDLYTSLIWTAIFSLWSHKYFLKQTMVDPHLHLLRVEEQEETLINKSTPLYISLISWC